MTLRRAWTLTAAAALLLAGCAAETEPEAEAPAATDPAPEDVIDDPGADEPAADDPAPATSELARQWAEHEVTTDQATWESLDDLVPDGLPMPADGEPFPLTDPGVSSLGGTRGDATLTCAGDLMLGYALAEGALGGAPDLTEADLAPAEAWFEAEIESSGWTIASKEARWTAADPVWELGQRGTVYRLDGPEPWYASVTLANRYSMSLDYCPVG